MTQRMQLHKEKWMPRVHSWENQVRMSIDDANTKEAMPYSLILNDEGLGDPASFNANIEHASYTAVSEPNCYPDSRITNFKCNIEASLTKTALHTDNLDTVLVGVLVCSSAFLEKLTATDVVTGLSVEDILELTHETTDRQTYPLGAGAAYKMGAPFTDSTLQATNYPGLTTTQKLESCTFRFDQYYDAINYSSIAELLKTVQSGIKWVTLTRDRPRHNFKIFLKSAAKTIQEYTHQTVVLFVPNTDSAGAGSGQSKINMQYYNAADLALSGSHVHWKIRTQYDEYHESFNTDPV